MLIIFLKLDVYIDNYSLRGHLLNSIKEAFSDKDLYG